MHIRRISVVILIGLIAVMLAACGGSTSASTQAPITGQTINVDETEFAFTPNTFNASVGQPIAFRITNKGTVNHTFVILGLDGKEAAKTNVVVGATETLQYTPAAAGTYQIICDLPGHKEANMTATLTVK
jgi:plastocyanin